MRYYAERVARSVLTVWAAVTLTFGILRLMPGGPLVQLRGQLSRRNMSPEEIENQMAVYKERLNYADAPIHEQYITYVSSLLQGDFGESLKEGEPVLQLIGEALPWTVFVMTVATILIFAIAIVWGALTAYREGSTFDKVSSVAGVLLGSIPFYVFAFILLLFLAYENKFFPASGRMTPLTDVELTVDFIVDVLHHAALPIASVVVVQAGLQMLSMRGNSIQVLGEDYVRVARLRGLSDRRISTRYVARNAILPMYTGFLTLIGFNIGNSVILEQVFTYRGIGYVMFDALEVQDYSILMGVFLVFTIILVVAVLIADLTYSWVDPRVKSGDASEAY
ncbi:MULTISPECIES: ABC transporter permease [Halomicrobium]|uniref:Binding-protein-dependent transport systems inner membrane component n=2 Tax=Halomicrobium mukohataei TaxID=57705 RepID=C7P287_HALMD|nr:binding-protein-dependent transport systems inner membrane component [Halomicrobium mukohataei DSM 12286]